VAKRATENDTWGEPEKLDLIPESTDEWQPSLSADGLELYFGFTVPGDEPRSELRVATRETKDSSWGVPMSLGPVVNAWVWQGAPRISSDGLLLLWTDGYRGDPRPGGFGYTDIWFSRRATRENEWTQAVNPGPPINTEFYDEVGMVSADGSLLYFGSTRPGGLGLIDIWQAPILPVVDLNGDGTVDAADMIIMVDHWGTDNSLCDIGPMPWGDGIVDVEDLIVLAEHLFEEVPPTEPVN
jgi:hypothetical protein